MICPKCNAKIKDESNFCSKCGAKCENITINDSQVTDENYVQSNNGLSGWGVLLLIFIIADVISWIIFAVTQSGLFGMLGMFFLIMS